MKTIKQAAMDHFFEIHGDYNNAHIHSIAFKAGVSFAEQWISIKDELPDYDQLVLTKDIYDCYDLMYLKIAGDERVSEPDEDIFINGGMWYKLSENLITHWRPINRK